MAEGDRAFPPAIEAVLAGRDWSSSPLGHPPQWSQALTGTFAMMRRSHAQIVLFWGPEFVALYNDAYAPTIGAKHPGAFGAPARENWAELWDDLEPLLRRVRDTGETISARDRPFYIERHGYGETAFFDISYSLVDDDDGGPGGVLCIVSETTARVTSTRAVADSEKRLRALLNASADFLFRIDVDWQDLDQLNAVGTALGVAGATEAWRELIHPEDLPGFEAQIAAAREQCQDLLFEHRLRRSDGTDRWVAGRIVPIFGEDGGIVEWFGAASDVTERHRAEEHQQLLMHELDHRIRNTLAVVQSIAEQTFRDGIGMADARKRFCARIMALAQANSLLTGDRWASASLASAIDQALRAHQPEAARLCAAGPDVAIPARTALTLTLALHELATNATKYGAWSNVNGFVEVHWTVDCDAGAQVLRLDWREHGGPTVTMPARRGFGSRLIERGLASELDGTVELRFDPEGVSCRVVAPLRD